MAKKEKPLFEACFGASDNPYASLIDSGILGDCSGFIDTGCYALNGLLSGSIYLGLPDNKSTVLAGDPATGKTYLMLDIMKQFLDQYPTGAVFVWESEFAYNKKMFEGRGMDTKRIYFFPVSTLQEFRTQSHKVIDTYLAKTGEKPRMMMCLDSLGMLSSSKELEDAENGKDVSDMTKGRLARSIVRTLIPKLGRANVPFIMTNHTYSVIGSYVPTKKMGGGEGPMYAASTVIFLSKSKLKDEESKKIKGNIIKCEAVKSRFTREGSKCSIALDFSTGLDKYYGLFDIAEFHGVIRKEGKMYVLPGGRKAYRSHIDENPEEYYTKEVLDQIDLAVKAEFSYGVNELPEEYRKEEAEVEDGNEE
jgi:hypothetical protein